MTGYAGNSNRPGRGTAAPYEDAETTRPRRPASTGKEPGIEPSGISILSVPLLPLDLDQAVTRIRSMVWSGRPHQIVLANAHTLNCAYDDPGCLRALQGAALVLRDGVGVEVAGALAGRRMRHNFVGTDFVPYLLEQLAEPEVRVFCYGAAPGVAGSAANGLRSRHAGIRIVGVGHGYENGDSMVARIRAARPDVLLVALGNPLQERWIADHLEVLEVPVAIGVGALFDYLADRVRRAPRWVRTMRGEWLFRLIVEPRRLWRRYLIGNAQFLWRVIRANPRSNGRNL